MEMFIMSLTIFVLAIFVGVEVINKAPYAAHTLLMSGTNAISGIVVVGAILSSGGSEHTTVLSTVPRRRRHHSGNHQHRGWFYGNRPHAEHVQKENKVAGIQIKF